MSMSHAQPYPTQRFPGTLGAARFAAGSIPLLPFYRDCEFVSCGGWHSELLCANGPVTQAYCMAPAMIQTPSLSPCSDLVPFTLAQDAESGLMRCTPVPSGQCLQGNNALLSHSCGADGALIVESLMVGPLCESTLFIGSACLCRVHIAASCSHLSKSPKDSSQVG